MGKSRTKIQKGRVPEHKLLKALTELEDAVEKSDPLEDADPEGGFSTEGTPLSDQAPSGKTNTKKSRGSSSSSASDSSSVSKADDSSDDDDSDDESSISKMMSASDSRSDIGSTPPFRKKKAKVSKADASSDEASSDAGDGDGDDDASSPTEKSFRETAEGDETMAKAIEVSPFIEAMVDQLSLAMLQMAKSIRQLEERLSARIDHRVAKSFSGQQEFNARLAKAVAAIGNSVQGELVDMVKSLANAPAAPRGKAVLSKAEINQPPWGSPAAADSRMAAGSDGGGDFAAELSELPPEAIGDWLFKKSATNQLDPQLILAWEADRYNVEALPSQVRKALANDLLK